MSVDEFNTWPIPEEYREEFESLRLTHKIMALPVYDDLATFIEVGAVNAALRNSLVEVHFNLKHHVIRENGSPLFDTFTAFAQQVTVLQRAPPKKPSAYRKNIRRGPVTLACEPAPDSVGIPVGTPDANFEGVPGAESPQLGAEAAMPLVREDDSGPALDGAGLGETAAVVSSEEAVSMPSGVVAGKRCLSRLKLTDAHHLDRSEAERAERGG